MKKKSLPSFSYAGWARLCGFSKGHLHEIVSGKKRLTTASAFKLRNSLKTSDREKDYFLFLVQQAYPDIVLESTLQKKLDRVFQNPSNLKISSEVAIEDRWFSNMDWPYVFAALGDGSTGRKLPEISKACKIPESRVVRTLKILTSMGLAEQRGSLYFPVAQEAYLKNQGKDYFRDFHMHALEQALMLSKSQFADKESLFMTVALPVNPIESARLREELQELLVNFCEYAEDPNGSRIMTFSCNFY